MSDAAARAAGSPASPSPGEARRAGRRPAGRRAGLRGWLAGRTLRGRLIAGLVALLAVACACVGLVTYLALRGFLFHQLDAQLSAAGRRYVSCVEDQGGPPPAAPDNGPPTPDPQCGNEIPGQAAGTFSAQLVKYTVSYANIVNGTCHLSVTDQAVLTRLPANGRPYDRNLPSAHGEYRLTAVRSPDGDVLVTGLPLGEMQSTLHSVEIAEIAVFSIALLLTGIIGTGWVRLSLRPLRRVTATAAEVTRLPLGSGEVALPNRVPDSDPRTEVGQLGVAFNRMLGHVESALARRHASEARLRTFAADASHELRTPLAAIRGYAELARRHPGALPDDVAHALSRVESESARMSGLVDDLLLLARLDAGRPLADDPVDLTRLAIDAASDARAAAPDHRWQLDLPGQSVVVRGDEHRLRQVLANLMSNAARHTPPGTTVTVTLAQADGQPGRSGGRPGRPGGTVGLSGSQPGPVGGPARPSGGPARPLGRPDAPAGTAVLAVADDGPGIPAELQPELFERFVRGDSSRSRAAGSTGLGLAIVDAVVAAHHGHVEVTSRPGQTVFMITLPLPGADSSLPDPS
jgi:two-component system OmpR family sensor kinase